MKYINFKADEVKKINDFLVKYGDRIAETGIRMVNDRVCFLYSDESPEEYIKNVLIQSLKSAIIDLSVKIASSKSKELLFRKRATTTESGDKYAELVVNETNQQSQLQEELNIEKDTLALIEAGELNG